MQKPVTMIKLNNLQYHPNRDPEFYRRTPGKEFRLQAFLGGSGNAQARFESDGETLCESGVSLPGAFDCRFRFDSPGTRIGTLTVIRDGETFRREIRLDVNERRWVG